MYQFTIEPTTVSNRVRFVSDQTLTNEAKDFKNIDDAVSYPLIQDEQIARSPILFSFSLDFNV